MMVLNFEAPCFVPNTKIVTRTDTYPESDVSVSTFLAVSPTILDIPSEAVSIILTKLDLASAVSFGMASKNILAELRIAPLSVSISSHAASLSASEASYYVSGLMLSLSKYLPCLTGLDFCSASIEDRDALHLCANIRRLKTINLSGCKRLTSKLCTALCSPNNSGFSALTSLNLQRRCFQLNKDCLYKLIKACARYCSDRGLTPVLKANQVVKHGSCGSGDLSLKFLAMSHLDLGGDALKLTQWGKLQDKTCNHVTPSPPLSQPCCVASCNSLRILALNNCTMLDAFGLLTLALACPCLNLLLLGGSSFNLQLLDTNAAAAVSSQNTTDRRSAGAYLFDELGAASLVTHLCNCLEGSKLTIVGQHGLDEATICSVIAAVESAPALAKCPGGSMSMIRMASVLVVLALALPELRALELSFSPVANVVSQALQSFDGLRKPEVWDLTQAEGVHMAISALMGSRRRDRASEQTASQWDAMQDHEALAQALRCAVGCSWSGRTTPLHCAVSALGHVGRPQSRAELAIIHQGKGRLDACCEEAASVSEVRTSSPTAYGKDLLEGLIQLGAVLDARDTGGATALFLAAELGNADAVEQLLAAGADASISNAAGESPLYIASLKGHVEVVRVLVRGFTERSIPWHRQNYTDGWTPLMAAAVADHYEVACLQLDAIGDKATARLLVAAVNRYGQSALHIAARKGSLRMIRLLLGAGGEVTMRKIDHSGKTPMDVASNHCHHDAINEFSHRLASFSTQV